MANLNIAPQSVLLTSGQAVTFQATNNAGQAVPVNWSLSPSIGALITPTGTGAVVPAAAAVAPAIGAGVPSTTYVAPPLISGAQMIAVVASTADDSASATISLTPDAIVIVPAKADLKAHQQQRFIAMVAVAPTQPGVPPPAAFPEEITWVLSPPFGTLDQTGMYEAPPDISDSMTVNVIAASRALGKQAVATVSLASPPWQGPAVNFLGVYLLLVFSLVFLIIGLWPPALPTPDAARADRIQAERTVETLENARGKRLDEMARAKKDALPGTATGTNAAKPEPTTPADAGWKDLNKQIDEAKQELKIKQDVEKMVNDPNVNTRLTPAPHGINRELDLLWLVLLAGALGSFLHVAQSYSDYVGNKTLKSSWAWWYSFRPFIGAGLALVFYAAVRGGVMAIATGSNAKASELNPFGVVSVAAMVGMFSKAATMKLGEVFDTLFKSDKAKESKDTLTGSQPSTQMAGKTTTGASTSTGTK